ncbi:MAG: FAD-binding oxidoreductase [Deltaproteobacteria bacterium]
MGKRKNGNVGELRRKVRGEVILPGDPGYEGARRIWNGMFDRRPAVIVQCVGTSDVVHAVHFARDNRLLTSVKGGGHNSAGNAVCDGGIVIDLSRMRGVAVDPKSRKVRVDGGALLGDVDAGTQLHGLAVSAGIVSHTGVGGLTLGGGFGWISRRHGFSIDNLESAEVVTADGALRTAGAKENPDLYWGIRGGGGNFGVVTSFSFRAAEIGTQVYSGLIVKKFPDAEAYLRFHRDYVRTLPDGMTVWLVLRHAPPLPFLPKRVHGSMVVVIPFVWLGKPSEGERLLKPVRRFSDSLGEHVGMNPWVDWQGGFDGLVTHGARNYWKSHHLRGLSDACIDRILEFAADMPTGECEVFIPHMEGTPSRVPETATAFAHRTPPFVLNIHTRWQDPADDRRCIAWAKKFHRATEPFARGVYVNFLSDEGEERVHAAYSPKTWKRLVKVKKRYDPDNLFRMNQNIRPS